MGFAPCVSCKPLNVGCTTRGESAILYHARVFTKDLSGDFHNRRLKPSVRSKYEPHSKGVGVSQAPVIEGTVTNKKLMGELYGLNKEVKGLRLGIEHVRRDTRWIMVELQRVSESRHDSTTTALSADETTPFSTQPVIHPASKTPAASTPNPVDQESIYSAAPPTNRWTQQPALATLMGGSTWMPSNSGSSYSHAHQIHTAPEVGTLTPGDPYAHTNDANYPYSQGDGGHRYGEGSSSGLSSRDTGW
jgi:hypothetical protein